MHRAQSPLQRDNAPPRFRGIGNTDDGHYTYLEKNAAFTGSNC